MPKAKRWPSMRSVGEVVVVAAASAYGLVALVVASAPVTAAIRLPLTVAPKVSREGLSLGTRP